MERIYIDTVRLLLEAVPYIFHSPLFAMKGGTALNLFVEELPRLSVDIDVVYTDHNMPRRQAMETISAALAAAQRQMTKAGLSVELITTAEGEEIKLFIRRGSHQVKVEVNHVFPGTVLPVEARRLTDLARELFTTELSAPVLARAELYGSKLVAAMDRQHPRDFFDVGRLLDAEGLSADIVECFVCYLSGHNRPVHEVLFSRDQPLGPAFENELVGMTRIPVSLARLEDVRRQLKHELPAALTANQRQFLISLVEGNPDWRLMRCPHLKSLPAIGWKLLNLAKLKKSNPQKFDHQAGELRARLTA